MKCPNCGSDFASDQLRCPYCSTVNEYALKLAKELQTYDEQYEECRDEIINTGSTLVLKHITRNLGITFLVVVLLFEGLLLLFNYRFGSSSTYQVTGSRYTENLALMEEYMNNKEYLRALSLATSTDPTQEHFTYYPEYQDELNAIWTYSLILIDVKNSMDELDAGDNYSALRDTTFILFHIFYSSPDSSVKDELTLELDQYLKNHYQLTLEEIQSLKEYEDGDRFTLDGSTNIEEVTKERMVAYYGR